MTCILLCPQVKAQPGSGIRIAEGTTLKPSLNLKWNYDDNVNIRRRALESTTEPLNTNEDDTSLSYTAELALNRIAGNRTARARLWYGEQYYGEFEELDSENYGVNVGHFWTRTNGRTTLDVSAGYEYAVDRAGDYDNRNLGTNQTQTNFETVSERVERDITSAEVRLTQDVTTDVGSALVLGYYDTAYADDVYNDRTAYDATLELNYQYSIKTQPYARLSYSIDEDNGYVEDAEKPAALIGVRYNPSEKLRFDVAVGYEEFTRTPWDISYGVDADGSIVETGREPGVEQEDSSLKYTAAIFYEATRKTSFSLRASNGFDSVAAGLGTSRKENRVSFSMRHQTTPQINQSFLINYRKDEFYSNRQDEPGEEEFVEVKDTFRYEYRINYNTVRPWLSFFGNVNYEDGESEIESENYEQVRITLGTRLSY